MSPTRTRRRLSPAWLAMLFLVGCAVETRDGSESATVEPATPAKKPCAACQSVPAYLRDVTAVPPAPVFYGAAPVPPAPAVAPVVYAVAPTPVAPATALIERNSQRPVGIWEREIGACRITLRFEEDRLFGTCAFKDKKDAFTVVMDADYSVTKDNVLYGVITGSEATGRDDAEEAVVYVDMPFSARVRQDGDALTVKGVKFLERGVKNDDLKELIVLEGRYKKKSH